MSLARTCSRPQRETWFKVFDSDRKTEALVVKGLLDSAGIDSDITSVDAVPRYVSWLGGRSSGSPGRWLIKPAV